jgi:hypothetical protein
MPQRFLRPGITTSRRFNRVPYCAQTFYLRLITLVDDFGLYEADFRLLRSHAFPFGDPDGADIPLKTIENICQQLSAAGLVLFYKDAEGKQFLQVSRWQERARAGKSKFKGFDNTCEQMFANDNKCSPPSPSPSPSPSPVHLRANVFIVPADAGASLQKKFEEWMTFRKGLGKKPKDWSKMFSEQWQWIQQFGEKAGVEILSQSIRNGWQGLFEPKSGGKNNSAPPITNGDPKRWLEFIGSRGITPQEHRFAPEYLRLEFARWRKGEQKAQ